MPESRLSSSVRHVLRLLGSGNGVLPEAVVGFSLGFLFAPVMRLVLLHKESKRCRERMVLSPRPAAPVSVAGRDVSVVPNALGGHQHRQQRVSLRRLW
jgi:hypothetical protein